MSQARPFYLRPARGAKPADISQERIDWFVRRADQERDFSFSGHDSPGEVLKQLLLEQDGSLLNAALMLFGKNPQRFCPGAVVKCARYYGTKTTRPIPFEQVFGRTLFEQVDSSVDFVLSILQRTVGGREASAAAAVQIEIPREAITEIIVNAVVHRDYNSAGSVQITVFADRIEILNPGRLPRELSIEDLSAQHLSIPVNPFLARPFYLAAYINQLGFGTRNVIEKCRKAGLPDPLFRQLNEQFCVTIWRNWITDDTLADFSLNERQTAAVRHLKEHRTLTNSQYQNLFSVAKRTATQDLQRLVAFGLLAKEGTTGKGVFYRLAKGASKGHKGHAS